MSKVYFAKCEINYLICMHVDIYLPKSLVHTAMRTSSSEQGLQATEIENMTKKNHFNKELL